MTPDQVLDHILPIRDEYPLRTAMLDAMTSTYLLNTRNQQQAWDDLPGATHDTACEAAKHLIQMLFDRGEARGLSLDEIAVSIGITRVQLAEQAKELRMTSDAKKK